MRIINKPVYDIQDVYKTCANSIRSHEFVDRLLAITGDIVAAAGNYDQKTGTDNLFLIAADNNGEGNVVIGAVTKKKLKDPYSKHMVPATKPARHVYDELIGSAPSWKMSILWFWASINTGPLFA